MGEDQERIAELEAAAALSAAAATQSAARIDELEAAALNAEAAALVSDSRIAELVLEVQGLEAAREHAAVINQAKGVLMNTMHINADAAFAVLVAASQRENVKLYKIAERIAAAQHAEQGEDHSG